MNKLKSMLDKRRMRSLAIAGVIGLFVIGTANAAHKLILDDTSTVGIDVEVEDNMAGDFNLAPGVITYIGAAGTFAVNVTTSVSKPVLGNPYVAEMDLNDITVSSPGGGTLVVANTDTGFANASFPGPGLHRSIVGGTLVGAGSVSFLNVVDDDNLEFGGLGIPGYPGAAESTIAQGPFGPGAFSSDVTVPVAGLTNPFSMSSMATLTLSPGGSVSFDNDHQVLTPEASSMALLLPGLLPLGLILRRRMKKSA